MIQRKNLHSRGLSWPTLLVSGLLAVLFVVGLSSCDDDNGTGPINDEHLRAMQLWRQAGMHNYDFTQRRDCFCVFGGKEVRLKVRSDSLRSGIVIEDSSALSKEMLQSYCTVDSLFSYIEMARAESPASLIVEYDSLLGYPRRISVDFSIHTADDEFTFWSSDLVKR